MNSREEQLKAFGRLLDVLDELREKCPWDRKQTNESLRPNTIEETYELCEALMRNDDKNICKELGDVLLHVCFYAKIGSEKEQFDMADVCNQLCDKLIFRHPHVFPPQGEEQSKAETAQQVIEQWELLKQRKRWQQKRALRRARRFALAHQGLSHSGQGTQCGIRLGRTLTGVGKSKRRNWRIRSRS